jgi:hypothetical protein
MVTNTPFCSVYVYAIYVQVLQIEVVDVNHILITIMYLYPYEELFV